MLGMVCEALRFGGVMKFTAGDISFEVELEVDADDNVAVLQKGTQVPDGWELLEGFEDDDHRFEPVEFNREGYYLLAVGRLLNLHKVGSKKAEHRFPVMRLMGASLEVAMFLFPTLDAVPSIFSSSEQFYSHSKDNPRAGTLESMAVLGMNS